MTRAGIFGWSYPPGVTTLPGDEPSYRQIKTEVRRAITDYRCDHCSQKLARGSFYRYTLYENEEGELVTEHSCADGCSFGGAHE